MATFLDTNLDRSALFLYWPPPTRFFYACVGYFEELRPLGFVAHELGFSISSPSSLATGLLAGVLSLSFLRMNAPSLGLGFPSLGFVGVQSLHA